MRTAWKRWWIHLPAVVAVGCASSPTPTSDRFNAVSPLTTQPRMSTPAVASAVAPSEIVPVAASSSDSSSAALPPRPAYAQMETLPIDLPTVLRLVNANSPLVQVARARVMEAQARVDRAEVQWLPNLTVGTGYNRFDGQTQNQRGDVFGVSRANVFVGGGPGLTLDLSEALYAPLIARRLRASSQFQELATTLGAELEAALAYQELVQLHGLLAINADTLNRAEEMLKAAKSAKESRLDRTPGDVNRAKAEVLLRRAERHDLEGRVATASARLARLLNLAPNVKLIPAESTVTPVTLIEPTCTLDDLLRTAITTRPDLAAGREAIEAAWAKVRQAEREPFLPKIAVQNQTGLYGGGLNDDLTNFSARNALSVQLFWEVRNLGFGNRAMATERRAITDQARYQLVEAQARAAAEVVDAAQTAVAKWDAIAPAQQAVEEALELYRINKSGTMNVVNRDLFDALRPLQAIQALNTARINYLNAVIDYNRAQLRLLTALGGSPGSLPARAP